MYISNCLILLYIHIYIYVYVYKEIQKTDDYRFCYLGPKGSWTPFHRDVLGTFSWSVNINGSKLWYLLDASITECQKMNESPDDNKCPYNIFALQQQQQNLFQKGLICMQYPKEGIFVPSGWYHQVHNCEDTLSINHNWCNAFNIHWNWNILFCDLQNVKQSLQGFVDYDLGMDKLHMQESKQNDLDPNTVQQLLKSYTGMDLEQFVSFLEINIDHIHNCLTQHNFNLFDICVFNFSLQKSKQLIDHSLCVCSDFDSKLLQRLKTMSNHIETMFKS
ncbi:transcription factor [Reticulomyxa filosa]|uniref:Transcription factor n=1 Tax=Reticulomyxa filosa TaxID=46433 RepID=X6LUB0_RETFI|nr:transcription factor [Reticulomyxa filosa]|eukprot:ETO05503.1 transcription factor [Reticulomyxa filosa]